MDFQLNDLRKASVLATANFLVAIGCVNTIEFLGGVRTSQLGVEGQVKCRFKAGVGLLKKVNGEYRNLTEDQLYALRNGLTHQYLPEVKPFENITIKNDWNSDKAITIQGNELVLNVARLVRDLGIAWGRLRAELEKDQEMRKRVQKALDKLPKLR
jgi:hypothetical protein